MNADFIERDERALSVENAGYRLAYMVLSYGLLILVMVRAFFFQQSSWDLLALVVAGGLVATAYQAFHQTLSRRWLLVVISIVALSALIGAVLAFLV
jgi:hypothetical protein